MLRDEFDYIIVGDGLAGVTLALQLHNRGKKLVLFSGTDDNVSSIVAAGLYNPITGRKMVKTWHADLLFPYLKSFYQKTEEITGDHFLNKKTIYRPFISAEEQNEWMAKSADKGFESYIEKVHMSSTSDSVYDPFGGLALDSAGYLDIPSYLRSTIEFLNKEQLVFSKNFEYANLELENESVEYEGLKANKVLFCEGIGMRKNPYLNWLPLRPVKGEILFIKGDFDFDYILNRGVFVLSLGNDIYKVGSTYDHHDLSLDPTAKAKQQMLDKLKDILQADFEVVDQIAGIRPATKDRRPFLGIHPKFETIGVFNGLGTKGVSLAPFWSEHFVEHLEQGKKLDSDVNISRHFSLYSESH